jgi:hypothetical protein
LASLVNNLFVILSIKAAINSDHDRDDSKDMFICGGGDGHGPGSTDFNHCGRLSSSMYSDVFSGRLLSDESIPSKKGTILNITNKLCVFFFFASLGHLRLYFFQILATIRISVLHASGRR